MKVLLYSHTFFPDVGGLERHSQMMAGILVEYGHKVSVLTPSLLRRKNELDAGYAIIRTQKTSVLHKAIQQHDVVLVNGGVSIPITLLAKACKKPLVVIHAMAAYSPNSMKVVEKMKYSFKQYLNRWVALHIGVSSEAVQSQKIAKHIRQETLYNPVDSELAQFAISVEHPRPIDLLYAGRIIEGKGVFLLVEALKLLEEDERRVKVHFAGEGSVKRTLAEKIQELRLSKVQVCFSDFLSGEALAKLYQSAKVLVLPSTTHLEGCPLSILEAFTFGLPVIASNQRAIREVVQQGGLLFKSGDAKALKTCIVQLLYNQEIYQEKAIYALLQSKKYDMKVYKKKFVNLVESVLK